MTALIVDDEEQSIETLAFYLKEFFPDIEIVGKAGNIIDAGKVFYDTSPDIVFLDISMPLGTGFDLANQIDFSSSFIIFVTAHSEYAIDAIKINAFDYLLKPVHITELTRVVNKVRNAKRTRQNHVADSPKIKLKYEGKILVLSQNDFIYASSEGNYTKIHVAGRDEILISRNIKKIEEEYFSEFPFFRTHQSFIVNLTKVIEYDANNIKLAGGIQVPVSKARFEKFKQMINQI